MVTYFIIGIAVSLIVLAVVRHGNGTSFANYRLTVFGIIAWFIPYPLITQVLPSTLIVEPVIFSQTLSSVATTAQASPELITDYQTLILLTVLMLSGIGAGVFFWKVSRVISLKRMLLKSSSLMLDSALSTKYQLPIYSAANVPSGMLVGIIHPIIVISASITEQRFRELIATHEVKHLVHGDNVKLLLLEFATSVLWWNPLVRALANKNRFFLEACCDDRASKEYGTEKYIKNLAELMLYHHAGRQQQLISNATSDDDSNISRIKFLLENRKMTKRNLSTYIAALLSALLLMAWNTLAVGSTDASNEQASAELGALITLQATIVDRSDAPTVNTTTSDITMWVDFNKKAAVSLGNTFMLHYQVTDLDPLALFEMEIVETDDTGDHIVAKPTLKMQYGRAGTVEIDNPELSSYGYKIHFTLTKTPLPQ